MKLVKIDKDNIQEFSGLFNENLLKEDLTAGVGCLDDDESPIGAALLDTDGERLIISSLFVEEGSRRKGAGSLMLEGIVEMSKAAETSTVEAYFTGEEAEAFFLKNLFLVSESAPIYRINARELVSKEASDRQGKANGNVACLKDLKKPVKNKLNRSLEKLGYLSRADQFDQDLSFAYTDDKGNPVAFVLTDYHEDEGIARVELLNNLDADHPEYAMGVLMAGLEAIRIGLVPPETEIEFVSVNEKMLKTVEVIAGGEEKVEKAGSLLHAGRLSE